MLAAAPTAFVAAAVRQRGVAQYPPEKTAAAEDMRANFSALEEVNNLRNECMRLERELSGAHTDGSECGAAGKRLAAGLLVEAHLKEQTAECHLAHQHVRSASKALHPLEAAHQKALFQAAAAAQEEPPEK
ncbi:hypothetical protein KFL_012630020 [Klebsormidium nitens]|uniref:Uncharacterized protein n=1 Tax=Klebsormidium nitens TaxID=105231 RepID=A0A1Y1IQP8_KLENI|nr:hypothetical protein KFL_012630020 [Klebsormidium nitens]|eukprot:GAQ93034.1 hypothetical protein KFL_012630020 [Klebsormidium nitens]